MKKPLVAIAVLGTILATADPVLGLQKIQANEFKPSMACLCHQEMIDEWTPTMHAKALSDPIYRAKRADAIAATKGALAPFCDSCHGPVATMGGEDPGALEQISVASRQGVFCDFCHQVQGTRMPLGNASYMVNPDGTKRAQIKDPEAFIHLAEYSRHHTRAEFCGMCHNVDHPVNGMHLEATYTEWKASPYAKAGIVCQDCHMTPGPGPSKPRPGQAAMGGPKREDIYDMSFVGGNVALGNPKAAQANLKAAAKLELDVPRSAEVGKKAKIEVRVTNVGAGHYLPTGLTEVRQMWLEVKALDSGGREILSERRDFGTVLKDKTGNHPAELWDAVAIYKDDRIPPQKSVIQEYELAVPDGGPVTVEAALKYRSAPEELAEKAGVAVPVTTMASVAKTIGGDGEAAADSAGGGLSTTLLAIVVLGVLGAVVGAVWWSRARNRR